MSPSAEPPTAQEVQRKLSVAKAKCPKPTPRAVAPVSGTESDSDAGVAQEAPSTSIQLSAGHSGGTLPQPSLSSIAEHRSASGEDSEEEEDAATAKRITESQKKARASLGEGVLKAGYLWKKGERRKTWKKRWFVLRPAHLAYYKTSAEYELLRLLDLAEVHSCTQVNLKRHENTFGLVSPVRTFYLQANSHNEVQEWVSALEEARQTLMATSTQNSIATPMPIPHRSLSDPGTDHPDAPSSPRSLPPRFQNITSSDSDDPAPLARHTNAAPVQGLPVSFSPTKAQFVVPLDPAKAIISGYLMKCGLKRKTWRKRWFVLTSEKLIYSGSHMDTKHQRTFPLSVILDALEYDLPVHRHSPGLIPSSTASPPHASSPDDADEAQRTHTFKIVTTKRTLLLCAPSEEEEIKWLGGVRALIARRSGAGVVPGESGSGAAKTTSGGNSDITPSSSGGLKGKTRRMSGSAEDGNLERKS